jgi:hypothetical protein
MKKFSLAVYLLLTLVMVLPCSTFAQKMKVISGNFEFLKGQQELNVVFDYAPMTFYNEKMSENDYLEKRNKDISANKGTNEAENWKNDWAYSKSTAFPNKFFASMNTNCAIVTGSKESAPYTLVVQTTWIYPGWFAGVMKQHAKVTTLLKFIETANPANVLLEINSEKAPGDFDFVGIPNTNDRIAEGYAKTAKSLAKLITKKIK